MTYKPNAFTDAAGALVPYRSAVATADGTGVPAANDALWSANPGGATKCRVFASATGSPTGYTLRAYLRSGGSAGQVGTVATVQTMNSNGNDCLFDVQADYDDVLILVETLTGGTSPQVAIQLSWRR